MVEARDIAIALGVPPDSPVQLEELGRGVSRAHVGAGEQRSVIIRRDPDDGRAGTHAWTVERLAARGFRQMPRILGVIGHTTIEEDVPGVSALSLEPPQGAFDAAIEALAAFHGLDSGAGPEVNEAEFRLNLLPDEETPLFRLGFSSAEREPAAEPLREARALLRETPAGPCLRFATADHLLLGQKAAWIVDFGGAGTGLQYFDVAAFLITAGASAAERTRLARSYAEICHRNAGSGGDPEQTADIIDLAGIIWGIEHELELPRRQILAMGNDAAMERLVLASARVNRAFREPAGHHQQASDLRAALWPS